MKKFSRNHNGILVFYCQNLFLEKKIGVPKERKTPASNASFCFSTDIIMVGGHSYAETSQTRSVVNVHLLTRVEQTLKPACGQIFNLSNNNRWI